MDSTDEPYKQYEIREGIVFLIELSDAIFTSLRQLNGQSQIVEILSCINDLLSEMVMTYPNNGVGIYFYNCNKTSSKYPRNSGLNKLFSLNDLNSSNMKSLIKLLESEAESTKLVGSKFPVAEVSSDNLHTVLETVLREFQQKTHYNRKKLFWLTNNDVPYKNEKLKDSLRTMVTDFESNYIHITPLFLDTYTDSEQQHPKPFDVGLYRNIFLGTNYLKRLPLRDENGDEMGLFEDTSSWSKTTVASQIRAAIFRLKEVRRVQFSCDLILSDGSEIGGQLGCSIKGYTLYNHEHVRPFKKVDTESGEIKIAHTYSKFYESGSPEEITSKEGDAPTTLKGVPIKRTNDLTDLEKSGIPNEKILLLAPKVSEFMRSYSFDHVPNLYDETGVSQINNLDIDIDGDVEKHVEYTKAPYLKLLCFRYLTKFQPYFNMKAPLFVAADLNDGMNRSNTDGGYTASFDTFRSLYQSCLRLKKYAIVFGCTKKNSKPDLYALVPTNTSRIEKLKTPDGFLLINIPWMSEVRSLPNHMLTQSACKFSPKNEGVVPPKLVAFYAKLLDGLGAWPYYEPSMLNNPTLNFFYKTIKQEALQLDIGDEDSSLVGNDWSAKKLVELRQNLVGSPDTMEIMQLLNKICEEIDQRHKRGLDDGDLPAKKQKIEPLSEDFVISLWKNNNLATVTIPQLKNFMSRYDIKRAIRKDEMIANIVAYLESRRG